MVLITIVTGANLNQLITGGPHIVYNGSNLLGGAVEVTSPWHHGELTPHVWDHGTLRSMVKSIHERRGFNRCWDSGSRGGKTH